MGSRICPFGESHFHGYCTECKTNGLALPSWNKDRYNEWQREYQKEYRKQPKRKQARRDYDNNRLKNDLEILTHLLRIRVSVAVKSNQKVGSAVRDLGCSILELKQRFEKKFTKENGWSWTGPGRKLWQIDHIKPLSSFKLQDHEQFLEAVNYKNLQPLSIPEHHKKSMLERSLRYGKGGG